MRPETRYAMHGDAHVAYQVLGDGPIDVVFVFGYGHLELAWEYPLYARFMERMATYARVIIFDKLGTGLSDPVSLTALPTLEHWMDDVRAVMDAAGSEGAAVIANFEGGPMAMLFAATYPQRATALVLVDTYARLSRGDDYPAGIPQPKLDALLDAGPKLWGTGWTIDSLLPSQAGDAEQRALMARFERASVSPGTYAAISRMNASVDVRDVLRQIRVPTLVIHRAEDNWIRAGHGRYLAENIPDAKYVELPGTDVYLIGEDVDVMSGEIQEFLTGVRSAPYQDRVLATVLFTDIVDSTRHAEELGDAGWRDLLLEHNRIVRAQLAASRGREIKTTGDGFVATFDGPARAIQCAHAIAHQLAGVGLEIRAGLHTGECELIGDDVSGIAVHIAARVMAEAMPGEVLVSSTVKDLVAGSGIAFADRGRHTLKGVDDEWRLFTVDR